MIAKNYNCCFLNCSFIDSSSPKLGVSSFNSFDCRLICSRGAARSGFLKPVKAMESSKTFHIEANKTHQDVSGTTLVFIWINLFVIFMFCECICDFWKKFHGIRKIYFVLFWSSILKMNVDFEGGYWWTWLWDWQVGILTRNLRMEWQKMLCGISVRSRKSIGRSYFSKRDVLYGSRVSVVQVWWFIKIYLWSSNLCFPLLYNQEKSIKKMPCYLIQVITFRMYTL